MVSSRSTFSLAKIAAIFGLSLVWTACGDGDPAAPKTPGPAEILRFEADPPELEDPGLTTLSWETSDATSVALVQNGAAVEEGEALPTSGSVQIFVDRRTEFELIATGAVGEPASAILEVVVINEASAPSIASFTGPEFVEEDEGGAATATLGWSGVIGAETLSLESSADAPLRLDVESMTPAGELEVNLDADTTFTLVAANAEGETRAEAEVRIARLPSIEDFEAARTWIGSGEEVEVSWTTTGAVRIGLLADGVPVDGFDPSVTNGSFSIALPIGTQLELRAFNEVDTMVSRSLEVQVARPEVVSFEGHRRGIWLGQPVELSWTTLGASELLVEVEGFEEPVCAPETFEEIDESGCEWTPPEAGTYTIVLSATNLSGVSTETWTIEVGTGPILVSFEMEPEVLDHGESVRFSWEALPDPDGELPLLVLSDNRGNSYTLEEAAGTFELPLTSGVGAYEFTLVASTSNPLSVEVTASAEAFVHGVPAITLEATPSHFDERHASEVVLEWTSEHASELVLYQLTQADPIVVLEIEEADRKAGSHRFVPLDDMSFQLVAKNELGTTVTAEAVITTAAPEVLHFTATPNEALAGEGVLLSWDTNMGREISLDIFRGGYVREELAAAYEDITALDAQALPLNELFEAGWPEENLPHEIAMRRVYVGIWTLRKMGLSDVLLHQTDGYLIDPNRSVHRQQP